ncbi:hypothetical protein [Rhizomonospora bruguierae]|uniref:hypothetical protein n=1 Tax=Rhizomonospora bruguierae TaxID=1581705 RepID=UPI001BCB89DA|nr:hypothetical protein [Micromonospora sp. NBRC 107566]
MAQTHAVILHSVRAERAWAVVRLTRPWFWPLGWAGTFLGSVLATGRWLPEPPALPAYLAAYVVLGPLVWGAVLALNDLHDLPGDRRNPRKATASLVTGALTRVDLRRARGRGRDRADLPRGHGRRARPRLALQRAADPPQGPPRRGRDR